MTGYTHLSSISVQGAVESSAQGKLIGSFTALPAPSELNKGQIVLYMGETTSNYTKGKYYTSDGTKWSISDASASTVVVDTNLNVNSGNAVANKAVTTAINSINNDIGSDTTASTVKYRVKQLETSVGTDDNSGLRKRVKAIEDAPYATQSFVSSAIDTALTSALVYKGSVAAKANLPASGNKVGDMYNVVAADSATNTPAGTNWAWNGTAWDPLGGEVDLSVLQPKLTTGTGISIDSNSKISLATSGVSAGTIGSAVAVPQITIDAYGRITSRATVTIYPPTDAGTNNQYWKSDGSGVGVWTTPTTSPASGSATLISAGGVFTALGGRASIGWDSTPTASSQNAVYSGGVYDAIDTVNQAVALKQDKITVSTAEPTSSDGSNGDLWAVYE